MPIVRIWLSAAACLLPLSNTQAEVLEIANAAQSFVYVRDCRSNAARIANSQLPDRCEATGNLANTLVEERYAVALGGISTVAAATSPLAMKEDEVSRASVDAAASPGQLLIRQASVSGPYARVSAWNEILQSYAWDGQGSTQRTIGGSLDFSHQGDFGSVAFNALSTTAAATIDMSLSVFSLSTDRLRVDTRDLGGADLFEDLALTQAGYRNEALIERYGVESPLSFSASFALELGRTYFVEARVATFARFGGQLDASHTFSASIGDLEGLSPAQPLAQPHLITNVPEPGNALLLLAGLLGLAGACRRGWDSAS